MTAHGLGGRRHRACSRCSPRLHASTRASRWYISENGAAYDDVLTEDGTVHDAERVAYIDTHLSVCHQAIEAGVPLEGYFAWSLMDNFEWAWGYGKRFGLVYVDYPDPDRAS